MLASRGYPTFFLVVWQRQFSGMLSLRRWRKATLQRSPHAHRIGCTESRGLRPPVREQSDGSNGELRNSAGAPSAAFSHVIRLPGLELQLWLWKKKKNQLWLWQSWRVWHARACKSENYCRPKVEWTICRSETDFCLPGLNFRLNQINWNSGEYLRFKVQWLCWEKI